MTSSKCTENVLSLHELPLTLNMLLITNRNIRLYLLREQGFKKEEILVLMDDGWHHAPTRENITKAFKLITEYSEPGDVVFLHYSGHGSQVRDTSGDEVSGFDSTLVVRSKLICCIRHTLNAFPHPP